MLSFIKKAKINNILFISIILIFVIIIISIIQEDRVRPNYSYDLEKDGCCVFKNVLSENEISMIFKKCKDNNYKETKEYLLKHEKINALIHTKLNNDYIFQDYIMIIQKSSVHTCHRDYNGGFFNNGQTYPSYTMIIYLEDMDKCLGIIPTSHTDLNSYNTNFSNSVENILCSKGDIILFNANLIHVGTINEKPDNIRVQLKITHKNDIDKISYYQNYNKVLKQDNNLPKSLIHIQKNISCMFPFFSNLTQTDMVKTSSRGSDNGEKISSFQKWFSYLFYGNSNFYDLPNAF